MLPCLLLGAVLLISPLPRALQIDAFTLSAPSADAAGMRTSGNSYVVDVKRPVVPFYMTQIVAPVAEGIVRGTPIHLRFRARVGSGQQAPVQVRIERSAPPFTASMDDQPVLGASWRTYDFYDLARETYAPREWSIHFQLGSKAASVEIGGVRLMADDPNPDLLEARAALQPDQVSARIKRYRMGALVVRVVDRNGRPVPGASVEVAQTRHKFLFGSNIFELKPNDDSAWQKAYQSRFASLLNYTTLGFYWGAYERQQGRTDEPRLVKMAQWCNAHGITPKGHPLTYHLVFPDWAPKDLSVVPLVRARIQNTVRDFRGLIRYWDVFNEIHDAGASDTGIGAWVRSVGPEAALGSALQWAREAAPEDTFLYNDYKHSEQNYQFLRKLAAERRLPDAIGIQSHMHSGTWPLEQVWQTCQRYSEFGRPLHFTETTVLSGPSRSNADPNGRNEGWDTTAEGEREQADYVARFYTLLFSHPSVRAITWWDFSDRNSWQGAPAGLIRKDGSPKPAYLRLMKLIKHDWWTNARIRCSKNGRAASRAFFGDYTIRATSTKGKSASRKFSFNSPGMVTVVLP